jgi:hypothetical protein
MGLNARGNTDKIGFCTIFPLLLPFPVTPAKPPRIRTWPKARGCHFSALRLISYNGGLKGSYFYG